MNHPLESHKFFPYVAWTLVIGFALFTYNLTITVQKELEVIADGVERLEQKLDSIESSELAQKPV